MKVDFDNLRVQTMNAYNNLIQAINENAENGVVTVDHHRIEKSLNDLRSALVGIACLYDSEGEFSSVIDKVKLAEPDFDIW